MTWIHFLCCYNSGRMLTQHRDTLPSIDRERRPWLRSSSPFQQGRPHRETAARSQLHTLVSGRDANNATGTCCGESTVILTELLRPATDQISSLRLKRAGDVQYHISVVWIKATAL